MTIGSGVYEGCEKLSIFNGSNFIALNCIYTLWSTGSATLTFSVELHDARACFRPYLCIFNQFDPTVHPKKIRNQIQTIFFAKL